MARTAVVFRLALFIDDRPCRLRWRPRSRPSISPPIAPTAASPCSHAGSQLRVSWPLEDGTGRLELDLRPGQPLIRTMGIAPVDG